MGGGDLNMKKHFHPLTMANLEKVWIAEQNYKNELRKIDQRKKEIEEEKNRKALLDQASESGLISKQSDRLEWMYSGNRVNQEEYLLGREIDTEFIEECKAKSAPKNDNVDVYSESMENRKVIDMERKIKEDPLFLIKRKELSVTKDIMSNSERLKQIMSTSMRSKRSKDALSREGATPSATPLDRKSWATPSVIGSVPNPTPTSSERRGNISSYKSDKYGSTPSRSHRSYRNDAPENTPSSSQRSYRDDAPDRTPSRNTNDSSTRGNRGSSRKDRHDSPEREDRKRARKTRDDRSPSTKSRRKRSSSPDQKGDGTEDKLKKMMQNAEWRESTRKTNVQKVKQEEDLEKKILEKMQRLRQLNADTSKILENAKFGKLSSRRFRK